MAPESTKRSFHLPTSVVSPTDVARLVREIDAVDSFFRQNEIRQAGQQAQMPRMSELLDQLAAENQLNMLQEEHRAFITNAVANLHKSAPVVHMSFSIDPPGSYVQKIVAWMRQNIHPQVLVTVGLQPTIGAGCIVRTTNKIFDFSLREYFAQKRGFFIDKMHEAIADQSITVVSEPQPQAVLVNQAPATETQTMQAEVPAAVVPQTVQPAVPAAPVSQVPQEVAKA